MQKHFEYRRGQDACKSLSVILSKQLWALDLVIFLLQRSQPTKPLWWTYFSRLLSPLKPESFPFLNSVLYNLSQRCLGVNLSWSFTLSLPRSFLLFESCFFFLGQKLEVCFVISSPMFLRHDCFDLLHSCLHFVEVFILDAILLLKLVGNEFKGFCSSINFRFHFDLNLNRQILNYRGRIQRH